MTTAPAPLRTPRPAPRRPRTGSLRVVRPVDGLDLDAALAEALGPHRTPESPQDVADVVDLDAHRRRSATWARHRRRRAVLVLAAVVAVALVAVAAGARGSAADAPAPAPAGATVVLEPGQTLWDVAADATPAGGDVRATLAEIRRLNDLDGAAVPAWTPVVLPAAAR